jgi:hypothetical protein
MSGKVVSWAFEQITGSPAAKLLLVKLADNANDHGFCWVGLEKIITESELSQSAVYKHMATLQSMGLVRAFDSTHPEYGYPIKAFQLSVPEAWRTIPPRGKTKAAIPPGGKSVPPHGKGIPAGGKEIPLGGIPIEEPSFEPSLEPSSEPAAASPPGSGPVQADLLGEDTKPPSPAEILDAAFSAYDEAAARNNWGECQAKTEARKKRLAKRLQDAGGLSGWNIALEKCEASDFMMGRAPPRPGQPPFRLDIDFLLQQQSFVRLMEGKYDNRGSGSALATGSGYFAAAARLKDADTARNRH